MYVKEKLLQLYKLRPKTMYSTKTKPKHNAIHGTKNKNKLHIREWLIFLRSFNIYYGLSEQEQLLLINVTIHAKKATTKTTTITTETECLINIRKLFRQSIFVDRRLFPTLFGFLIYVCSKTKKKTVPFCLTSGKEFSQISLKISYEWIFLKCLQQQQIKTANNKKRTIITASNSIKSICQ